MQLLEIYKMQSSAGVKIDTEIGNIKAMIFQANKKRTGIRTLLTLKDLINYSEQGKLKILSYKKNVLADRIVKSQIRRYLESDLSCPVLDRDYCSINLNLVYFLKTMKKKQSTQMGINKEFIQKLLDCAIACEECAILCQNEDNSAMLARSIALDQDCAEICFQAIKHAIRNSENLQIVLTSCERICILCAEECRKHNLDHCHSCADACEQCAKSCQEHRDTVQLA